MIFRQFDLANRLDVLTNALTGHLSCGWTLMKCFSAAESPLAIHGLERLDLLLQALQRVDTLPGGQRQRLAMARSLAH
jgi:phosphonate transport system ATP-binding protein